MRNGLCVLKDEPNGGGRRSEPRVSEVPPVLELSEQVGDDDGHTAPAPATAGTIGVADMSAGLATRRLSEWRCACALLVLLADGQ